MNSIKEYYKNYFNFKGRTNRKDFWIVIAFYFVITIILNFISKYDVIMSLLTSTEVSMPTFLSLIKPFTLGLSIIWGLVNFIPLVSIQVRRLHDINDSGWWILAGCLPLYNIILLVYYCKDSINEGNKYNG